jgi:hypothetical protein
MVQSSYNKDTGKGLHSNGQVAKIKPALEDLMKQYVWFVRPLCILAKLFVKGSIFLMKWIRRMRVF